MDPLAVFRPAEVALILRLLEPATLRLGFALLTACGLRAVALVVTITMIGSKELLATAAFALGWRGISLPDSKKEASATESAAIDAVKNRRGREANETSPNKVKKSFCVKFRRKSAVRHAVFKPVGLPDFEIAADSGFGFFPARRLVKGVSEGFL